MSDVSSEGSKEPLPSVTLEESYRICSRAARRWVGSMLWPTGNLSRTEQRHLHALLAFARKAVWLCDARNDAAQRLEELAGVKDELRDNLMHVKQSGEFVALVDTIETFKIPQQYFFDLLAAADLCCRVDRISSFDQWLQLGCRVGGSCTLAALAILNADSQADESTAIKFGQGVFLTYLLCSLGADLQLARFLLPSADADHLSISSEDIGRSPTVAKVTELVQQQVQRVDAILADGMPLLNTLPFEARRVLTSVASVAWTQLAQLEDLSDRVLSRPVMLSRKTIFRLRLKHVLGLEGDVRGVTSPHLH